MVSSCSFPVICRRYEHILPVPAHLFTGRDLTEIEVSLFDELANRRKPSAPSSVVADGQAGSPAEPINSSAQEETLENEETREALKVTTDVPVKEEMLSGGPEHGLSSEVPGEFHSAASSHIEPLKQVEGLEVTDAVQVEDVGAHETPASDPKPTGHQLDDVDPTPPRPDTPPKDVPSRPASPVVTGVEHYAICDGCRVSSLFPELSLILVINNLSR